MLPDPNWINALKLPTQVVIGLFIASVILLGLDWVTVLQLSAFGQLAKPTVIIIVVISGSLSFAGAGAFLKDQIMRHQKQSLFAMRRELRLQEKEKEMVKDQSAALERISHLSSQELRYFANCIRNESQSFYTYFYSPFAGTLVAKGLVYIPDGTYNQDHYPFVIHDFVWKALLERKDEILNRDLENRKKEEEKKRPRRYS